MDYSTICYYCFGPIMQMYHAAFASDRFETIATMIILNWRRSQAGKLLLLSCFIMSFQKVGRSTCHNFGQSLSDWH
jgi:hypothetical protein